MARQGLAKETSKQPDRSKASDEAWSRATHIARELDRALDRAAPMREAISRAAAELRLSTRQVYNHLARYRDNGQAVNLL